MSAQELPPDAPVPRQCHLIKWADFDGYGFNLHAEKARSGQFIGKVDQDSPAHLANLREGDRIIEVNGVNIANENHRQVVERIKSIPNETKLLVVDEEADRWYKEKKIVVKSTQSNVLYAKSPVPRPKNSLETEPPSYENITVSQNGTAVNGKGSKVANDDSPKSESTRNGNSVHHRYDSASEEVDSPIEKKSSKNVLERKQSPAISNKEVSSTPRDNGQTSRSSTPSEGTAVSVPDSPRSQKSSRSGSVDGHGSQNGGTSSPEQGLNLNMSAQEMRQMLASRKKKDPKKVPMDIKQKYEIIQQM